MIDGQTEVQIAAETVVLRVALEIAVGGGQDPDVDPAVANAADPPHVPLLHRLEQLALQRQLDVAHLVEEEEACPPRPRTGPSAIPSRR